MNTHRTSATSSLIIVLLCLGATLALGLAHKAPCAAGDWADGRQYERYCYSDLVPLLGTEQLVEDRLPYIDPCTSVEGQNCDEYPVLSMYAMRVAAWFSNALPGYFYVNALMLAVSAVGIVYLLYRSVGRRALYFALAPTLVVYAFINWDLYAVAAATAATYFHLRRKTAWAGIMIGVGAAFKLYPALLVIPFALDLLRRKERTEAVDLTLVSAASWLVFNLPFALAAREGWSQFFRFNRERGADFDSIYYVSCSRWFEGASFCGDVNTINLVSALLFVGLSALVFVVKIKRQPDFPRWTFAFPLLILFLLTNKVYSPQYSLWLLPWFALVMPRLIPFIAFSVADVAVFFTRFGWFGEIAGLGGVSEPTFQLALIGRYVVLIALVVAYVIREAEPEAGAGATTPARPPPPPMPAPAPASAI